MIAGALACLALPPVFLAPAAEAQAAPKEQQVAMPANEARRLGLEAIRLGQPEIAAEIAVALLQRDPSDSFAHFLMANSLMRLKDTRMAERAAKQAYRHAKTPEQSFQSAQLAADLAFRRGALTTSQWWLRKAAEAAPDINRKDKSVALFRAVKARNPWRVNLAFSVRPSDNVNNGSSGQYNIIDGLPYIGSLSQDAQAVKGVVSDAAVSLGYRLRQTAGSETRIGADFYVRRVHLSGAEKERLGGDPGFGSARLAFSLRQDWKPQNGKHRFSLEGTVGRQTYQSGSDYGFYGVTVGHRMPLADDTLIDSAFEVEQREKQGLTRGDRTFGFRSTLVHQRGNQDLISVSLLSHRFDTVSAGRSGTMVGAQVGYTLAQPIGPVQLSATFGITKSQYDGYSLAGIAVPGGRSDTTGFAEVQFQFNEISYAGFAPLVRLRHQRTQSNVSRFEAKESSVVLGLASKF